MKNTQIKVKDFFGFFHGKEGVSEEKITKLTFSQPK